jgi:peroxiredoxin family protein
MDEKNSVALIVFSGDLDKIFASLTIATGAAASGMKVTMFFTFWGLKLIQQTGVKPKGLSWMQKMFGWMVKAGPDKRPLSKLNMMGLGSAMLKKLMMRQKLPPIGEMMKTAKNLGVRFIACTTSMEVVEAKDSNLTLFI